METVIFLLILIVCMMQLAATLLLLIWAGKNCAGHAQKSCKVESAVERASDAPANGEDKPDKEMEKYLQGISNMLAYNGNAQKRSNET